MTAPAAVEDRTQFIGGSDIAAILGMDPYKTKLQVYEEKIGITPSFGGNAHTKRGIKLEAVAAEEYSERTGNKLHRVNRRLRHPELPFLTARVDRRIVGGIGRLAEIKCPSLGSFSKIKRHGLNSGYIAQFQHYLGLCGPEFANYNGIYAEYGEWIIFCADQWDMIINPVTPDYPFIQNMWEVCKDFWYENVVKQVPPAMTDADEERLANDSAEVVTDVSKDVRFTEAAAMLRDAKALAKESEQVEEEAKARVKELIGDGRGAFVGADFRLMLTDVAGRASFDKKALANAKPLDRLAVGAILQPLFEKAAPGSEIESIVEAIGHANLDLSKFETRGKSFTQLRSTFYGGER